MSDAGFDAEVAAVVAEYKGRLTDLAEEDEAGQQALFDDSAS